MLLGAGSMPRVPAPGTAPESPPEGSRVVPEDKHDRRRRVAIGDCSHEAAGAWGASDRPPSASPSARPRREAEAGPARPNGDEGGVRVASEGETTPRQRQLSRRAPVLPPPRRGRPPPARTALRGRRPDPSVRAGGGSDRAGLLWSGCSPLAGRSDVVGHRPPGRFAGIHDRDRAGLACALPSCSPAA